MFFNEIIALSGRRNQRSPPSTPAATSIVTTGKLERDVHPLRERKGTNEAEIIIRSNTFLPGPRSNFALSEAVQLQARGAKEELKALPGPTCVTRSP